MSKQTSSSTKRLIAKLGLVAVGMFGFGYLLVPLYDVFCQVTGLGGYVNKGPVEAREMVVDEDRLVTVEFVANVANYAGWDFKPTVARMRVHPGELYTTTYYAKNLANEAVVGRANYNVAPGQAARYFVKPSCFCFTEQPFAAGEGREMPVTFYVDPDLPKHINTVSLSYTFFDISG